MRIADVARVVGRSRRAIYKLWTSQEEFRADLAVYMVATTHEPLLAERTSFDRRRFASSVREVFEDVLDRQIETREDHAFRASLLAYSDQGEVRGRCATFERVGRERDARRLADALAAGGRRTVGALTPLDLVTMLRCAADGHVLFARSEPEYLRLRIPVDPERPSRLLPYIAGCVLDELTEAVDAGRGASRTAAADAGTATSELQGDPPTWTDNELEVLEAAAALARSALRDGTAPQLGALGHLTLERVARLTGEHRRSLYRCWPDHEVFRIDVLAFLKERDRRRYFETFDRAAGAAIAHPERFTMTVVERVTSELYGIGGQGPIARFALYPYTGLESVDTVMTDTNRAYLDANLGRIQALLDAFGWQARYDTTPRHLTALLAVLGIGGERMHRSDPAAIRRDVPYLDGRWSTIAIAHDAVERATIDKSREPRHRPRADAPPGRRNTPTPPRGGVDPDPAQGRGGPRKRCVPRR